MASLIVAVAAVGCGSSSVHPRSDGHGQVDGTGVLQDAGPPPPGLVLQGELNLIDIDTKYALVLDTTTYAEQLLPIPASGTTPGAAIKVPGGSQQTDVSQWVKTASDHFYYIDGAGSTGVTLYLFDPASGSDTVLASDLADQYQQTQMGSIGTVSQPFAVSPDGNWYAYMTMTSPPGGSADAGVRDAGGARRDGGASDAMAAPPATGWYLVLVPASGSKIFVAENLPPTGSSYFFSTDSKYLLLAEQGSVTGSQTWFATPVAGASRTSLSQRGSANAAPNPFLSSDDNLFLVGSGYAGDGTSGELDLYPSVMGAPVKIDTGVADRPQASSDGRTLLYLKYASTSARLADLMSVSIATAGTIGTPVKLQSGLAKLINTVSLDGKWLSYFTTYDFSGMTPPDINLTATAAGATPTPVGSNWGMIDAFSPDSSSYAVEYNADSKGYGQGTMFALAGGVASKKPDFSSLTYNFHYKNATTLIYDTNGNELVGNSDWVEGPAPTGMPATPIYSKVAISKLTQQSQFFLVPPDNSRVFLCILNEAKKDGVYFIAVP